MKLLRDGKPCEIDAGINITAWYLRRTRGEGDDEYGITMADVSDDEVEALLIYFSGGKGK